MDRNFPDHYLEFVPLLWSDKLDKTASVCRYFATPTRSEPGLVCIYVLADYNSGLTMQTTQ